MYQLIGPGGQVLGQLKTKKAAIAMAKEITEAHESAKALYDGAPFVCEAIKIADPMPAYEMQPLLDESDTSEVD